MTGIVLCEARWAPARRVSQACLWSNNGKLPPPRFPAARFPEGDPRAQTAPVTRCPWHTCSSLQRAADGVAGRVSKGPGEVASAPLPSLHLEPSASSAGVLRSSPATNRQKNSWKEAGTGARLIKEHSSSLQCSRVLLLLLQSSEI